MIDNPEDVQSVKDALKELESLRTALEEVDEFYETAEDQYYTIRRALKGLIYKWNEETGEFEGDPNPYRQEDEDEKLEKAIDKKWEEDD